MSRQQGKPKNCTTPQHKSLCMFWHRQRLEVRFCLLFAALFALLYWLLIRTHGTGVPWTIEDYMTRGVVWLSGQVIALLGVAVQTDGTVLRTPRFGVRVLSGCNGTEAIILYSAAVLAYPTALRAKGIALLVGLPAIQREHASL